MQSQVSRIEGPNLVLRLITMEDAAYVHGLRTNPDYNRYLSEVRGTAEDQRRWIEAYKSREAEGIELYYVIERKDGQRCGLVRLYEIAAHSFTWGSWIRDSAKPPKAALESAVLSLGIGFEMLDRAAAFVDVRIANERAVGFYRRFGMCEAHRTLREIHFFYSRRKYEKDHSGFMKILCEA